MNQRKRMGNDPFENLIHLTEGNHNTPVLVSPESNFVPAEAYAGNDVENSISLDEKTEIRDILKQVVECIDYQQKEIELLRLEMNNLKNIRYLNIIKPSKIWLHFWFPWFPG